jgi:phosphoribosyl-dephospho-CoA transferase
MTGPIALLRHELVWCDPDGLNEDSHLSPFSGRLRSWFAAGYPAIARRRTACDSIHAVPLAVTLPIAEGLARIGFTSRPSAVLDVRQPPLLADTLDTIPVHWRDILVAVPTGLHVFGSLMWQHLTGECYLRATSDIDVLAYPRSSADLRRFENGLERTRASLSPHVDGELIFPGGIGVAWREWASDAREVLGKTAIGASLYLRTTLLAGLRETS